MRRRALARLGLCLATLRALRRSLFARWLSLCALRAGARQRFAAPEGSLRLPAPLKAAEAGVTSAGGAGEGWQASPEHSGRVVSLSDLDR